MRPTVHLERDGLSVLVLILLMPAYVIIMNVVAAVQLERLQTSARHWEGVALHSCSPF